MAVSISISITQNSQSIANNTSNVTVKVTASWTGGSHNAVVNASGVPQAKGWVKIDGVSYDFASTFNTGQTTTGSQVICTKTVNVTHASDGTKTLACSASYTTGVSSGTVTASASKTLTTIPRKSTLSASNGTLGSALKLTVTRQATSFTHTITYKCGSTSGTVCTKSSNTSISWSPPLDLAKQNTTGTSVSITFTITTYSGSSDIGSNTKTISCSIPSSVKPACSISTSDATKLDAKYGAPVKGMSEIKVKVTASGSYGSTIKSYSTTVNGKTFAGASFTSGIVANAGTFTTKTTVTDSRGRTASASIATTVLDYAKPSISQFTVTRCDANGVTVKANADKETYGKYFVASVTAIVTALNDKNSAIYTLKYKSTTDSDFTTVNLVSEELPYNIHAIVGPYEVSQSSSYTIIFTVEDDFNSVSRSTTLGATSKLFSIFTKGKGWAFGKIAELEGYLDVAFSTMFRKSVQLTNNQVIHGTNPATGEAWEALNPQNINGNTVLGWGNYDNGVGSTNIYGYDILHGVSNIPTPGTYRPYRRRGDTMTLTIRTAGYVTNSSQDVSFWIPVSEPIIGSPTVTVTSGSGFTLRQGDKYTHGSSASVSVSPVSYEATATMYNGIYIKAVFSNTTNVTNNDVIGIYWNGTITLS